jgi:hypothetical protein
MNKILSRITIISLLTFLFACSSTLHIYDGQQYLTDAELGTLSVAEVIQVYKFNGKEVQKTLGPMVIKAKPGQHRLSIKANTSKLNGDDAYNNLVAEMLDKTIFWDAVEGHYYQLVVDESNSDNEKVLIIDITNNTSM